MNLIKCEKLEKSMAELQFSIDAEAFKKAVADVFKKEGKKYPVQGFRKGKAPKALIEKMYGADVFTYDAINELFPEAFEAAVKEAGVEPVGRPEVTVDSASEAEGATLTVKVPVKPEVKVGSYNGLTVEKTVHTVTDEAVDAELKRVQERNARELTREGAAQNGDIADIDFEGFVDGVAFEGGILQGIGMALTENITYDRRGMPAENSLMQYKIPTRQDIGRISVEFEASYEETGPYGAKSIGEVVINTPLPAIADAVYNATGKRFCELPITPEQIAMAAK